VALTGEMPQGEDARRLARFGLAGIASARPAWAVAVSEAPEPRWTGGDPRGRALALAYELIDGDTR